MFGKKIGNWWVRNQENMVGVAKSDISKLLQCPVCNIWLSIVMKQNYDKTSQVNVSLLFHDKGHITVKTKLSK